MKEKLLKLHQENKLVGVFDLTQKEYREAPGLSRSDLVKMDKTAAHFQHAKLNPKPPTDAMIEGSALHCLVLEPDTFEGLFAVMPDDIKKKGTKKYAAWIEEEQLENCTILSQKQWEKIDGMNKSISSDKKAKIYLSGHKEKCFFWKDTETGVLYKCKPDSIHLKAGVISDLKSAISAEPKEFMRKAHDLKYHVQAAFYTDGVIEAVKQGGCGGYEFKEPDSFLFVVVEKEPPYCVAYYDLPPSYIDEGRRIYRELTAKYAKAIKDDDWSGYSNKIVRLQDLAWMYRR